MSSRNIFASLTLAVTIFSSALAQPNVTSRLMVGEHNINYEFVSVVDYAGETILGGNVYVHNADNSTDIVVAIVGGNQQGLFTRRIEKPGIQQCRKVLPVASQNVDLLIAGNSIDVGGSVPIVSLYNLELEPIWEVDLLDSFEFESACLVDIELSVNHQDIYLILDNFEENYRSLVKMSADSGEIIWETEIDFENIEGNASATQITLGENGRIFLGGNVRLEEEQGLSLFAFNSEGEMEWEQVYVDGRNLQISIEDMISTPDGGCALAGYVAEPTDHYPDTDDRGYLLIVNNEGDQLFEREFGDELNLRVFSIARCTSGGYVVGGSVYIANHGYDGYLQRVDDNGESMWGMRVGDDENQTSFLGLMQNGSGQFVACGSYASKGLALFTGADPNYNYFNAVVNGPDTHTFYVSKLLEPEHKEPYPIGTDVGVFYLEKCVGHAVWWGNPLSIVATSDDDSTEQQDGFDDGGAFTFAIWDAANMREIPVVWNDLEGSETFEANGFTDLGLEVCRILKPQMNMGWNIISSNVDLLNTRIKDVMNPLVSLGVLGMLKDPLGHFYVPAREGFNGFDNIEVWKSANGYQIKVFSAVSYFELIGRAIPPERPIELAAGWHLIAYYPNFHLPVRRAVETVTENLFVIKDDMGRFFYPRRDFDNMGNMKPGEGYWIKVTADESLVYPTAPRQNGGNGGNGGDAEVLVREPVHFALNTITGRNMSLLIENCGQFVSHETEVGVFVGERLVGCAAIMNEQTGLALWGDDLNTDEVDGAVEGASLTFKVWNGSSEVAFGAKVIEGDEGYKTDGLSVVELTGELAIAPDNFEITATYPTPFNSRATIEYALAERSNVTAIVFDQSGRQVASIEAGVQGIGHHTLNWEATNLPSGIYMLQLNAGTEVRKAKLVLLR